MPRILGCLVSDHDPWGVCLAIGIGLLACWAAALAAERAQRAGGAASGWWLAAAAAALGGGAWATHFIAMLAWKSGLPVAFEPLGTLGSAALSVGAALAGLRQAGRGGIAAGLGGLLAALGIAAMHYAGAAAVMVPGRMIFDPALVALSVLAGGGFGLLGGLALGARRPRLAALLLILAVATLHFTAMRAVTVLPDGAASLPRNGLLDRTALTWIVAGVTLAGLGATLAVLGIEARLRLASQCAEMARFRALAEASFEGLLICEGGRVTDANRRAAALIGLPPAALAGRSAAFLFAAADRNAVATLLAAADGTVHGATLAGGTRVEAMARVLEAGDGRCIALAIRDMTERLAAEARIQELAYHDPLTGLPNRTALAERLAETLARAQRQRGPVALLALDLDGFQAVNDLHGHARGDALLRGVAERLRESLQGEEMAARLGGDEFVVVAPGCGEPAQLAALAERIRQAVSPPGQPAEEAVSVSIGAALFPADGDGTEALMQGAEIALSRAKAAGRNGIAFFHPGMDQRLREQRRLERDLQGAAARGELRLRFQPYAETASGEVVGFEALLRWEHPALGEIGPDRFIPIAEASGEILPIGAWALRKAVTEAARWARKRRIAVNVSALQLRQPEFAAMVARLLDETGLEPSRLELEITETTLLPDADGALETLWQLRALGLLIALDDFGTGYSSLATLQAFPFDKIKIDRAFVGRLAEDVGATTIVRAVLGLGRSLRVPVTAEGVENAEQLAMLRREGCAEVQGWLVGRPACAKAWRHLTEEAPQAAMAAV